MGAAVMKIRVQPLSGRDHVFEVSPEATVREFKGQLLHQWQTDRSKLCVRLVLHDHVLVNDNETVVHAGICPEVSVQVIFLEGEEEEEVTKKDQENEVNEAIVYQLGALSDNSLFW
eukprot:symbB.v1.2.017973.t1/scaffold1402.1/size121251/2